MALDRTEPFLFALTSLRDRLRAGGLIAGERITATEIADELRLSPTPVREALSRLAGEGLLEDRRGQGFFVRTLTGADVADLYRLSQACLFLAHDPHRSVTRRPRVPGAARQTDPLRRVQSLFMDWISDTRSRALIETYRNLDDQLAPVRRFEAGLLDDVEDEARELDLLRPDAPTAEWGPLVRKYHAKRIGISDQLARLASGSS